MEAACCYETPVNLCQPTRRRISEDMCFDKLFGDGGIVRNNYDNNNNNNNNIQVR
jgi:hypothetical protein